MQGVLGTLDNMPEATDALLYEDDELDTNPCMLPLVRFIEKAASLYQPGDLLVPTISAKLWQTVMPHAPSLLWILCLA